MTKLTKLPTEIKIILFGVALGIGIAVFAALYQKNAVKTKEQVKKQVETYEEALPGYLEQKQKVECYRDSLMNDKVRQ